MRTAPASYTITATLAREARTVLYRATRDSDRAHVVLKTLRSSGCRPRDVERLRHEHEIAAGLVGPSVVKPLALEVQDGLPVLVLEDFGGQPLEALLTGPMPTDRFLSLAVRIAAAVADLHQQGVIHRDLKPDNILVVPETLEVKLADLGLATRVPREQQLPRPAPLIEGSLPYMSPEQTGRMNRALDSRTDLYSLGVTFFRMLTGRLPFEATDPLGWVHCHVARAPPAPSELEAAVPAALDGIVTKLLAKTADDRYQTARGLRFDLERCQAQWRAARQIDPFPLGERDVPDRLQFPQRLYGRDDEVRELLSAFERVVTSGAPELVLVSGYSGVGKSSLVHEIQKPLLRGWGLFAEGKFDQYKRDIPYATLAQAFRRLVLDVLAERDERIAEWRERFNAALGMNGGLIAGLIPEIELIVGEQPAVPELPLAEAKNRFHLVFRQFLGVFARGDHPVALFLDDLQWADAASLELLADVLTHVETRNLIAIGAYRDNEVTPAHPLMTTLAAVRRAIAVRELVLAPLSRTDLGRFLADTLRTSPERCADLTALVAAKTAGNPFFVIQFLTSLHTDGLLRFDPEALAWRADATAARARGYTDNVVTLMIAKLQRLSRDAQEAVSLAACVGNVAAVETLALLRDRSEEQTDRDLWELVRDGLLNRSGDRYRFSHDRVQQAAYALIPEERRPATHLRIGRLLLAHTGPGQLGENVFDIVNQLNLGAALITDQEERRRLAELDLAAGRRAKASAAYEGAARYVRAGIELLAGEGWAADQPLAWALHHESAQLEYLLGNRGRSQELVATLLAHARDAAEKAVAYEFLVDLHTTEGDNERAVAAALECIALFGIVLTAHPTREAVQGDYAELWRNLGDRQIEDLIDLPPMTDRATIAALGALAAPTVAAMFTDLNLLLQLSCRMVNLCLRQGNSDAAVVGYVWLGVTLGPVFGKYREGYRFGKLAYDYVQRHRLVALKPRIDICFGDLVNFWTKPLQSDLPYLRDGFRSAVEVGDLTYACYCANHIVTVMITMGAPLDAVYRESEVRLDFVRKVRYAPVVDEIVSMQRFVQNMRGLTAGFSTFSDATFDERGFEEHLDREVRPLTVCWYYILKLAARFMSGDHREALLAAERARALLWSTPGHMQVPEYHYYRALSLAAVCEDAPADERRTLLDALRTHDAHFREWAENCAENFAAKSALVSAELARVTGEDLDAMRLYEQAIRSALDHGLVQNAGIAYELASRFYRARGYETIADTYLREARGCYRRWGADGKVRQLEVLHPRAFDAPPPGTPAGTIAVGSEHLDLLSVIQASQTISGEIVFERLLATLLKLALEQGGAQRVCLFLSRGEELACVAEAVDTGRGITTRLIPAAGPAGAPAAPSGEGPEVPASILQYARRTREPVILNDAVADARGFAADTYFALHRPRSVLCLPILRQSEVCGLLYEENGLVPGAFTPDRLLALALLAAQAAIAMQNSLLLAQERAARAAAEDARGTAERAKAAAEAAQRRAAFVAEAGALLASSLDLEETLGRVGQLCVRSLADWCLIDLADGQQLRRIAGAHADASKAPLLEHLRARYPPRRDSPHASAQVLRSGAPLLVPDLTPERLRALCDDDEHARLVAELGSRSTIVVPLRARGRALGALTLGARTPGRYDRCDLDLASELADRAGMSIDNAQLYREAQGAIQLRDEFLSIASHELRTPIQSLQLILQSLERGVQGRASISPRMLTVAARETERLAALVAQLVDVVRIERGRLLLTLDECDVATEARQIVDRMQVAIERAGTVVTVHAPEVIRGRWDRSRLDQLLTNLLTNALAYGAGQPVELVVSRTRDGRGARIAVRDRGIGIPADRLARVFERFERATSTRHYGGLGLGLFIARQIVEAHHGTISVESAPGRGSTFTVELPLQPPDEAAR